MATSTSSSTSKPLQPGGVPVAIVGAACQFPGGCDSLEGYWTLLSEGRCAIGPAPTDRWGDAADGASPSVRQGGFLDAPFPAAFDAAFFNIAPPEARALDPQHRLLLETGWRALESACLAVDPAVERPVGVFVGVSTADFHAAQLWNPPAIDAFTATGASFAAAAGRLSYSFGFTGPSLTVDTACSSSLAAFHLARQALADGECEAALVAGVNALLAPNLYIGLGKMRLLSPTDRCRPFDADADGYVRSEGCGAVVLKRLEQAQADGDRILAVCRGSSLGHSGRTNGLTAPSRAAQAGLIAAALARAGLSPSDIDYVEAHGTGTVLGDEIELSALADAYGEGRPAAAPLLVGSAKANLGHLEAAAGIAGLLKAVLCLERGQIPANPALRRPTPQFAWAENALRTPTELVDWPGTGRPRRAAVSAFGFSGTGVHVVLEAAPAPDEASGIAPELVALPLSARSPQALQTMTAEVAAWLDATPRRPADVALTFGAGRSAFAHRKVVVGASSAELAAQLRARPMRCTAAPERAELEALARAWEAGEPVDWARLYRSRGGRPVQAPGHPFLRRDYWPGPLRAAGPLTSQPVAPCAETPTSVDGWRQLITALAARVLSDDSAPAFDLDRPLGEQGFTSLLGVQLQNEIEAVLQTSTPKGLVYNYPSIARLAEFCAGGAEPAPPAARLERAQPAAATANDFTFLDSLSEDELATFIEQEIEAT